MTDDVVRSKLDHLSDQSGVYLFKDRHGDILYVGKAAVLADRVRSYFQKGADSSPKTALLVSQIADLETIVTRSVLEALILESNLIKRHRPRFNVVLRDDNTCPAAGEAGRSPALTRNRRRAAGTGVARESEHLPQGTLRSIRRGLRMLEPGWTPQGFLSGAGPGRNNTCATES